MPDEDTTNPGLVITNQLLLSEIKETAASQTAKMESIRYEQKQQRNDNRQDHQLLFKAQGKQGERVTACEADIRTMKPRVDKACNGVVETKIDRSKDRENTAGMRAEVKILLGVLAAAGIGILGALIRGWMGG